MNEIMLLAQGGTGGTGGGSGSGGGGWNITTFFENGKDTAETAGGAFLALIGVIALLVAGFKVFQKLTNEQSRESWAKIVGLVVLGGVLLYGGYAMLANLAEGGKNTIDEFGDSGGGGMAYSMGAPAPAIGDAYGGTVSLGG